jgi:hypothetical protein
MRRPPLCRPSLFRFVAPPVAQLCRSALSKRYAYRLIPASTTRVPRGRHRAVVHRRACSFQARGNHRATQSAMLAEPE